MTLLLLKITAFLRARNARNEIILRERARAKAADAMAKRIDLEARIDECQRDLGDLGFVFPRRLKAFATVDSESATLVGFHEPSTQLFRIKIHASGSFSLHSI